VDSYKVFPQGVGPRKDWTEESDFRKPIFHSRLDDDKKATSVEMFETAGGTFEEIFSRFDNPLEDLTFNQGQIAEFCYHHPDKIDRRGALFLFKADGQFFVASVFSYGGTCLKICANRFDMSQAWSSTDVVVMVPK